MNENNDDPRIPDMRKREALLVHVEGLQVSLTKRNQRIAGLEAKLADEGESELLQRAKNRAYKEGYKACASQLMDTTRKLKEALSTATESAFQQYLAGDNGGRDMEVY